MSRKIVIGSSMRFRGLVKVTMEELERLGFMPLFPNLEHSAENKDVALTIAEKKQLAMEHYQAIREADAVYFILPAGYMGTSCKIELGYALALGKPIYFSELTDDVGLDGYVKKIIAVDSLSGFTGEFD